MIGITDPFIKSVEVKSFADNVHLILIETMHGWHGELSTKPEAVWSGYRIGSGFMQASSPIRFGVINKLSRTYNYRLNQLSTGEKPLQNPPMLL